MSGFSPEEAIKHAEPGACVYAVAQIASAPEQTVFLIREQSGVIADLGLAPAVHIRAGLMVDGGILVLPVLIQVSGELYETWMNYHAEVCPPPWCASRPTRRSRSISSTTGAPAPR